MKNTLIFNLNNFACECLSVVDGGNAIILEANKSDFISPFIFFTLMDGTTTVTDELQVDNNTIRYEVPESYYNGDGVLRLKFSDEGYSSDTIAISCMANISGYSLSVEMESSTSFSNKITSPAAPGEFSDEWKSKINANTEARHSHGNKGILDNIESALTNMEIEALLSEEV